jgi:hypothetical protein
VYVDKNTYEVKYGVRAEAQPNLTGPFGCTRQDRRLTLSTWEGWCAVEEFPTIWALYFDLDDDGLRSKFPPGTRVLEVELTRKEKRFKLDTSQRLQDQATQRAVDVKAEAPTDTPIERPPLQQPGMRTAPLDPLKMPTSIFEEPQTQAPQTQALPPPKTPPPAYTRNSMPESLFSVTPSATISIHRQPTPPSEKRTTPRLTRTNGTRALEQAKRFERLSQTFKGNASYRGPGLASRPENDKDLTDIASKYVDLLKTGTETLVPEQYSERPDSSTLAPNIPLPEPDVKPQKEKSGPLPAQTLLGPDSAIMFQKSGSITVVSPTSDPAVFGAFERNMDEYEAQQNKSPADGTMAIAKLSWRKDSIKRPTVIQAPKNPLLPSTIARGDQRPGLSIPGTYKTEKSERRVPRPSVSSDGSASTTRFRSNISSSPLLRSRGTSEALRKEKSPRSSARAPSRAATVTSSTAVSRQRIESTSSQKQNVSRSSPIAPSLTTTTSNISHNSIKTTMTIGTKNQGIPLRLGPQSAVQRKGRGKTTSTLFREIDNVLQLEGSRSDTTTTDRFAVQTPAARARRPPPLEKAGTTTPASMRVDGSPLRRDNSAKRRM